MEIKSTMVSLPAAAASGKRPTAMSELASATSSSSVAAPEVSSRVKSLTASLSADKEGGFDAAKVAQIRQQLQDSTYVPSAGKIADGMLRSAMEVLA